MLWIDKFNDLNAGECGDDAIIKCITQNRYKCSSYVQSSDDADEKRRYY